MANVHIRDSKDYTKDQRLKADKDMDNVMAFLKGKQRNIAYTIRTKKANGNTLYY